MYNLFDLEGKGYLTAEDIKRVADDIGEAVTEKEAAELHQRVNTSGSNQLTFEEFYSVYAKRQFAISI